jgi:hypothetical protein
MLVSGNPNNRKATLWRKPAIDDSIAEGGNSSLESVFTLEHEGIKKYNIC